VNQEPTMTALGWLGIILFVPALVLGMIGNVKLHHLLRARGTRVPFLFAGMMVLLYPFFRPASDSAETDRIALWTVVAWLLALAALYFLGPKMVPAGLLSKPS